jgi:hypothetical protein
MRIVVTYDEFDSYCEEPNSYVWIKCKFCYLRILSSTSLKRSNQFVQFEHKHVKSLSSFILQMSMSNKLTTLVA